MLAQTMVLTKFLAPLEAREVEIPELASGEMLVQIDAAGVCGSDVHMWKGEDPRTPLPIILGHEGVGTILKIAGNKQDVNGSELKVGDRILWNRGVVCGQCHFCAIEADLSLCINRRTYGINRCFDDFPHLTGCYSTHILLDARTNVFPVPKEADPAVLVPASCSGATVAHAFDLHPVRFGDTVLVQGPGPLGMFAAAFAKRMGAKKVIVTGGSESRLAMCKDFGADLVLNRHSMSLEERRDAVLEATGGRGVDIALEAVGHPSAVHEGIKLVRSGGAYLSVGFSQPPGDCQVDFFKEVTAKNLKIQGVWVSAAKHTQMALELVLADLPKFSKLVTHRFALNEANEALKVMNERDALKAVLLPGK